MYGKTFLAENILHTKDNKRGMRCDYKLYARKHPHQFGEDLVLVYGVQVQVNLIHYRDTAYVLGFTK